MQFRMPPLVGRKNLGMLDGSASSGREIGSSRADESVFSSNRWPLLALLAALTAATIWIQLSTYPNHDVAWVLWGTREMLQGAEFGIDIIEPNPPLAWYLSMPTTALAMQLSWPLDWTFRIAVALASAISALCFGRLAGSGSASRQLVLTVVAATALLVLPGREFAQREHLAVLATPPYLGLVARRLDHQALPSLGLVLVIGVAAGLGFALKPYFLAVPLFVELVIQWKRRGRISLFRAENLAIGAVMVGYAAMVLLFNQEYLQRAVPLANEIYWSFNRPWQVIRFPLLPWLLMIVPVGVYAIYRQDNLGILLFAACLAFILAYVVQQKGYTYHRLPVTVIALVMLANLSTAGRKTLRLAASIAILSLFLVALRPVMAWWEVNKPGGTRTVEIDRILGSIDTHADNGRFLMVAVHPYPSFPASIYADGEYVSRTNSHWFLPATMQIRQGLARSPHAASIESNAREFILHDLSRQPDLVLIDSYAARHTDLLRNEDFVQFYEEDAAFRELWEDYREIEPIGKYRQFVRCSPRSDREGQMPQ
ncbi:hypothetical protein [Sphingomicrobium astaxanthinifaciens]|uniref:hypothetical protein n=1 Tax=Sphingomicrobium astaxanthinifaciens TaxID=1227949 RepID=UPI001FCA79C8|nr:hypothetical protein [Sphingomicrobium astaxanthinifaciens]MCJ7421412.1 hypothetical protein [Sphingomicrobium astaxanthinifaciens]